MKYIYDSEKNRKATYRAGEKAKECAKLNIKIDDIVQRIKLSQMETLESEYTSLIISFFNNTHRRIKMANLILDRVKLVLAIN